MHRNRMLMTESAQEECRAKMFRPLNIHRGLWGGKIEIPVKPVATLPLLKLGASTTVGFRAAAAITAGHGGTSRCVAYGMRVNHQNIELHVLENGRYQFMRIA